MRVLGIDLGTKRIGVAVSDGTGSLASPLTVVERSGDVEADRRRIAALVAEEEAEMVVIGLPLNMSGSAGPAAAEACAEAGGLGELVAPIPVILWDERLTTVSADRSMRASMPRKKTPERRRSVDMVAAAILLQSYLDAHREPR